MELYFNGLPLNPIITTVSVEPCLPGRTINETHALRYIWRRIQAGREYISLKLMSRQLGYTEEMCENYIAKFHAERVIPRMPVIEEAEG